MLNLAYLLDLVWWSLSQKFYLVKSKSTRAIHSLGCYTLKQTKITALKNSLLACSFCNNFSRCHVAETFYSIWCVIKELARDGSNYLRPEIWPVDHMVNCGYSGHKSCISQDARLNFARLFSQDFSCKTCKTKIH